MEFLYWLSLFAGYMGYGLIGLFVLIQLDQRWPKSSKVVMGSFVAFIVGWLLWPLSLLLVPFCHWMEKRTASDNA